MELDKRIKEGKRPLSCFDVEEAKAFLGKECYFTNAYCTFEDLNSIPKAILQYVSDNKDASDPYKTACYYYPFILPCEWVKEEEKKEPKYRPYTLKEFIGDVNLGGPWIRMRPVGTKKECKFLYTGYLETAAGEYICLGCFQFDLISLFKNYEICVNGEWQPFGIEEQV